MEKKIPVTVISEKSVTDGTIPYRDLTGQVSLIITDELLESEKSNYKNSCLCG